MTSVTPIRTDLRIRIATAEDAPSIASVLEQAFAEYAPLYTPEAYLATTPGINEVAARISQGPVWVALRGEQAVGSGSILLEPQAVYIRGMAVISSARGLGVGYRLLDKIERFAKGHGYTRLFLSTTPFLQRAIRLYESFGFRRTTDGPHDLFGTPLFTMEKIISDIGEESLQSHLSGEFSESDGKV
jgi:ribosomal protein S18 acetylase RimI-like enzyme